MAKITPSGVFGLYAGICALGYTFVIFCFPETAGLSLEEVRTRKTEKNIEERVIRIFLGVKPRVSLVG